MIRIYPLNGLLMQTEQDLRAPLAERLALPPLPEDWQAALAAQLSGRGAGGLILLEFARRMPDGLLLPLVSALSRLAREDARWTFQLCSSRQICHDGDGA